MTAASAERNNVGCYSWVAWEDAFDVDNQCREFYGMEGGDWRRGEREEDRYERAGWREEGGC